VIVHNERKYPKQKNEDQEEINLPTISKKWSSQLYPESSSSKRREKKNHVVAYKNSFTWAEAKTRPFLLGDPD
jgi:hypothetical protein